MVCWLLGERQEAGLFREKAQSQGILVFRELHRAIECMAAVFRKNQSADAEAEKTIELGPLPESAENILNKEFGILDEYTSKQVLSNIGIPAVPEKVSSTETEALLAASEIGFPAVVKGLAQELVHKSEKGFVRTGLKNAEDISGAVSAISKIAEGENQKVKFLIQRQIEKSPELIAGLIRDPQFGPCIMCGFGGIFAGVLKDTIFAVAPLTWNDAMDLINRLKASELLDGYRGLPPVDREQLAGILIRLGRLGLDYPRISEIDINPLMVYEANLVAVDATIILKQEDQKIRR